MIRSKSQIMSAVKKDLERNSGYFVICDTEQEYSDNLLKVLREKISEEYQFYLFHDIGKLKEFSGQNRIEILLIGEEYPEEERDQICAGARFLLTGNPSDGEDVPGKTAETHRPETPLFRYQPADRMIWIIFGKKCEITAKSGKKKNAGARIRDAPELKGLVGVYSPIHRVGKTRWAIRLGRQLAGKRHVLYLNMEGYAGGNYYFPEGPKYDLGDLIYYIRQENPDPGIRISTMAGQYDGMDFIMPMENEKDLKEVRKEEWMLLLDTILEKCIYDVVILDLGECIDGLYDILRRCTRIYTHYLEDGVSVAKMTQYEENLNAVGYGDLLLKTVKKKAGKTRNAGERSDSAV